MTVTFAKVNGVFSKIGATGGSPGTVPNLNSQSTAWHMETSSGLDTSGYTSFVTEQASSSVTAVQVVLPGWYIQANTPYTALPAGVTARVAIEAGGTLTPVTFSGSRDVTVVPGQLTSSDWANIAISKGSTYRTHVQMLGPSGFQSLPVGAPGGGPGYPTAVPGDGFATGLTADQATITGIASGVLAVPLVRGQLAAGATKPKSVFFMGDSITFGFGSSGTNWENGAHAWPNVFMNHNYAGVRYAVDGMGADGPSSFTQWQALASGFTNAVRLLGANSLTFTPTQLANWALADATSLGTTGVQRVFLSTVTPFVNSTDAFTTTTGQTPQQYTGAGHDGFNAWVRANCPIDPTSKQYVAPGTAGALTVGQAGHPAYGIFDLGASVEASTPSNVWLTAERAIADAATTAAAATVTSATAAFTSSDVGKYVGVVGAGASGGMLGGYILTVNSSTQVTLDTAATATVSAAVAGIGLATIDGVHPTNRGVALMAAVLTDSAFA